MKYKVEMQHTITFVVEAESEEQFMDWAASVTPTEAREMIEERKIIKDRHKTLLTENYYDTVLETMPDDTEANIVIKEELR